MKAYKGTFAANAATGSQTISGIVDESGASFTPKALFIWSSFGTSAAFIDGFTMQMGVGDATTRGTSCCAASDNVAAQRSAGLRDSILISVCNSAGTAIRTATLTSFASGQFTVNWTVATGSSEIFHFLALGGSDLSVQAVNQYMGQHAGTRSGVTFADLAAIFGITAYSGPTATGIGWAVEAASGAWDQATACLNMKDNVNPSYTGRYQVTDAYKSIFATGSSNSINTKLTKDSIGEYLGTGGSSTNVYFPCLLLGGIGVKCGSGLQPTSTGTQAISGLGFSPKAVILVSVGNTVSASAATEAKMSVGACDRTRQGHAFAAAAHNVTPSVCVSYEDTSHLISAVTPNATAASSTVDAQCSLQSIDSDGFTLNWGTADATQREYIWIAFGDDPGGSSGGASNRTFIGPA